MNSLFFVSGELKVKIFKLLIKATIVYSRLKYKKLKN